ncbi:ciliogenesis and planar polarity effector 1 isoform X3 [Polypterus senegalus]|uniref:ciliogenesis and planar polarity effector 1 isoform X3 n=1 Tax=Polypterus senegalus TaxID=55291 RepID=UPI0019643C28|nr:ciliogenesis and planar polarity effector 1 isoform X3 [Polypterus senegalus]
MEVKLEVLVSSSIKRKKPCPRFSWLGQEKENVFLLDDKCLSEISLASQRKKKVSPKLNTLLKNVITLAPSRNGAWLAGLLSSGEVFLWNKDRDCLKTTTAADPVIQVIKSSEECSEALCLIVSGDGKRILLLTSVGLVLLWESNENKDLTTVLGNLATGQWSEISYAENVTLPTRVDKERSVNAAFFKQEAVGDCCICSFLFTSEENLVLTFLTLHWFENPEHHHRVKWTTQKYSLPSLSPPCSPVKSRGALPTAFSGDGQILAIAVNQKDPKASQVLFVSTVSCVTVSSSLKGCGSKNMTVPSKYIRSYWVGDISWTCNDLYLACLLKRGALLFLSRLGDLLTLTTYGCSVEFGPAQYIPLHPLINFRPPQSELRSVDSEDALGSEVSLKDEMRQRFSVTAHLRLPYLIVSDGYMVTVLRVSNNSSPSAFMNSVLVDTAQQLEKIRQALLAAQPRKNIHLKMLSSLKFATLQGEAHKEHTGTAIPQFLQEDTDVTDDINTAKFNDENSNDDILPPCDFLPDCGRFEFASMFDTIHAATELTSETSDTATQLSFIQKNLLMVWSIGVSIGRMERKRSLLKCTIRCLVHLAHVSQFLDHQLPDSLKLKNKMNHNKALKRDAWMYPILQIFKYFLTVLYWDMTHKECLSVTVELVREIVKLFVFPQSGITSPQALANALFVLKLTSQHLNVIYTAQSQLASNGARLDMFSTPFLQEGLDLEKSINFSVVAPQQVDTQQKPSDRLAAVWKILYQQALRYKSHLYKYVQTSQQQGDLYLEERWTSCLIAQIQTAMQTAGMSLRIPQKLNTITGEQQFLLGSYSDALHFWRSSLQDEIGKDSRRTCFLQTRYYLAILYCHLCHYNLRAAQGLCDHLAREVLRRVQLYPDSVDAFTVDECYFAETWHLGDVNVEALYAVIQSMARFMSAYFTNHPLFVFPPHNVDVLPPLHNKPESTSRIVPLQHSRVASVVREQHLSGVWSVEYALDLLLIGGLLPEAVWLAHMLRDWKMAVSLGLAYKVYCQTTLNLSGFKWRELHIPLELQPVQIFQNKLQSLLGQKLEPEELVPAVAKKNCEVTKDSKQITDSIEDEDADSLFNSIQEILKAAVMAESDVLSETFSVLLQTAKELSTKLSAIVPHRLYLPAPPLYCPQPALDSKHSVEDMALKAEHMMRQNVSNVLQRVLLLFRAAHCSLPAAQWYIQKLKRCRKVMNKIRLKGSQPPLNCFPESLFKYLNRRKYFKPGGPGRDGQLDPVVVKTISCFRDLCGLCWMFHVREMLSLSCRKYQLARNNTREPQVYKDGVEYDAAVVEHCIEALEWACRLLPFSRFINAEEVTQDVVLSLLGELPPIKKVADIFVRAFPEQQDSIRVALREKYNSLFKRLRQLTVKGPDTEDAMPIIIQDLLKLRIKQLKRIARNIGPVELHIWERTEESLGENDTPLYDRFSLGTSLSRSTLTDYGRAQVYSDGDTADSISEQLPVVDRRDEFEADNSQYIRSQSVTLTSVTDEGKEKQSDVNKDKADNTPILPLVGSWEFECDDDEYINFLELFLTYLLERDLISNADPCVPYLTTFSKLLRNQELNSFLFDVHSTLKRHQNRKKSSGNVFRAGSCYRLVPETQPFQKGESSHVVTWSTQSGLRPVSSITDHTRFSLNRSLYSSGANKSQGLFGLRQQLASNSVDGTNNVSVGQTNVSAGHQSAFISGLSTPGTEQSEKYIYQVVLPKDITPPMDELTPDLQAQFKLTGRLLEWMIRWTNRRLLRGSGNGEKQKENRTVIRVKSTAPAILSSLWIMEKRYSAGTLMDKCSQLKITEDEEASLVLLPESKLNINRESSVDTGYPVSTETPVTLLDAEMFEAQDANDLEYSDFFVKHKSRQSDIGLSQSYHSDQVDSYLDYKFQNNNTPVEDKSDVPSETDESEDDSPVLQFHPSISVSIKAVSKSSNSQSNERQPILDEKSTQDNSVGVYPEELMKSELKNQRSSPEPVSIAATETAMSPERPEMTMSSESSVSCQDANVQTPTIPSVYLPTSQNCDAEYTPSHGPAQQQGAQNGTPDAQSSTTSEAVRQMLQDEMFRLVQLQQVNFMSLMQVVGLSFLNMPNVQQNLPQAATAMMNNSQNVNPSLRSSFFSEEIQPSNKALDNQEQVFTSKSLNNPNLQGSTNEITTRDEVPRNQEQILWSNDNQKFQKISGQCNKKDETAGHSKQIFQGMSLNDQQDRKTSDQSARETITESPQELFQNRDVHDGLPHVNNLTSPNSRLLASTTSQYGIKLLMPSSVTQQTPSFIPLEKLLERKSGLQLLKPEPAHQLMSFAGSSVKVPPPWHSVYPPSKPREVWVQSVQTEHPVWSKPFGDDSVPLHLKEKFCDTDSLKKNNEEKAKWADIVTKGTPKYFHLKQYTDSAEQMSSGPSQEADREYSYPTVSQLRHRFLDFSSQQLPLLHLRPAQHLPSRQSVFPPIQVATHSTWRIPPASQVTTSIYLPNIQSLQPRLPMGSEVIQFAPPLPSHTLIPLQDLIAFEQSKLPPSTSKHRHSQWKLLKGGISEPSRESKEGGSKREKWRKKQSEPTEEEEKVSDKIQPNASHVEVKEQAECEPQSLQPELGDGFIFPPVLFALGSFDSLLHDGSVLAGPLPTSAELHCFASTKKSPADISHAATNTDQAVSCAAIGINTDLLTLQNDQPISVKSYRDAETVTEESLAKSAARPITSLEDAANTMLPPDVFLRLRFSAEPEQKLLPEKTFDPVIDQGPAGRQFISVIDIEDAKLLNDLPSPPASTALVPDFKLEVSDVELSPLDPSVTNAVPSGLFTIDDKVDIIPTTFEDSPISSTLPKTKPTTVPTGDEITKKLFLPEDHSVRLLPQSLSQSVAQRHFAAKLSEMDVQLTALQNIAENMELEFSNTRLLVNTIEKLGTAISPEPATQSHYGQDNFAEIAAFSQNSFYQLEDLMEENEENLFLGTDVDPVVPVIAKRSSSPCVIQDKFDVSFPDFLPTEADVSMEDALHLTGLSDVADILGDLLTDNKVAASELGLSETQARKLTRMYESQVRQPYPSINKIDQKKQEVKEWMKRKHQQRQAEYHREREKQREQEHRPFTAMAQRNFTTKDIKLNKKIKEDKDKMMLSDHHSQRKKEALNLMNEILSENKQLAENEHHVTKGTYMTFVTSPGRRSDGGGRTLHQQKASKTTQGHSTSAYPVRGSKGAGPPSRLSHRRTPAKGGPGGVHSDLGLHRPASALPMDRMSQYTRRGMLTNVNSWQKNSQSSKAVRSNSANKGRLTSKEGAVKSLQRKTDAQKETEVQTERNVVSPWNPPAEIRKLLEMDQDYFPHDSLSPDVDGLSESTGSILSKLDWAAIEKMVASEEIGEVLSEL